MVRCPIITQHSQAADYSTRGDSKQFGSPRPSWFYTGFSKASRESLSFNFFFILFPQNSYSRESKGYLSKFRLESAFSYFTLTVELKSSV
jgi:hypothetical protein